MDPEIIGFDCLLNYTGLFGAKMRQYLQFMVAIYKVPISTCYEFSKNVDFYTREQEIEDVFVGLLDILHSK